MADLVAAARDVKDRLERLGLAAFCRTSGGKGLHVVAPLSPRAGWDEARAWCRAFAELMVADSPQRYVAAVKKSIRTGKILVDWLRNGLGSTAIASFSPRARDGAGGGDPPRLARGDGQARPGGLQPAQRAGPPCPAARRPVGRVRGRRATAAATREGTLMAARPIWRGQLRLALVSCPVALYSAHHERENLHFHFINPDTGHRVRMLTVDAENETPVRRGELVRGFEFKKDHYLILTDEEFDSVRVESSSTLVINKFVPSSAIDPVFLRTATMSRPTATAGPTCSSCCATQSPRLAAWH